LGRDSKWKGKIDFLEEALLKMMRFFTGREK
jgi:hypothetical protein